MKIPVALGAYQTLIAVGVRVSFDPPDAPVLYVGKYGTAIPATVAEGGDAAHGRLGACFGPALEIEESQRKGAGSDCGSL
jgi:hypothetical protein